METQPTDAIADNLWWVIPERLAGVRKPAADELPELRAAGIGAIVSVMDDPSNLDLYRQAEMPHLWLPVTGGTAPSREQVQQFYDFATEQHHLGNGVALHCTSGRRRTGTMLAAYLILAGSAAEEAIEAIARANPAVELRAAQLDFLQQLAGAN